MGYYLGIDGRLSEIAAAIYDEQGKMIACQNSSTFLQEDFNTCECDMTDFWVTCAQTVRQLIRKSRIQPEKLTAIGVSGEPEGLWAVDSNGNPVFSAISFHNLCAEEEAYSINEKTPGIGKLVHRTLGRRISSGSTLILLQWLKHHRLTQYNRIDNVFYAKDWLRYCMTDKIATDLSDIGGSLFRFNSLEPPTQLLTVMGVPEVADYIADVHPATDWIGSLTIPAAETMGCYPGTPVAVGASAVAASVLGIGAIKPEDFSVILNDECQILVMRNKSECDPSRYWNHYLPFISEDRMIEVISRFDGRSRLQWAITAFLEPSERQDVDAILQNTRPGCGGVVYCSQSTQNDGYSMNLGSFFGTNATTTRKEMLRAVYESVAFAVKACYQTVSKSDHLYLTGGDLTGTVLPQIIADVVGINVICTDHASMATKGAAICAALATAQYPDLQSAVTQCCTQNTVYEPHPCPIYDKLFKLYKNLRKTTIPLWQNRMEIGI